MTIHQPYTDAASDVGAGRHRGQTGHRPPPGVTHVGGAMEGGIRGVPPEPMAHAGHATGRRLPPASFERYSMTGRVYVHLVGLDSRYCRIRQSTAGTTDLTGNEMSAKRPSSILTPILITLSSASDVAACSITTPTQSIGRPGAAFSVRAIHIPIWFLR